MTDIDELRLTEFTELSDSRTLVVIDLLTTVVYAEAEVSAALQAADLHPGDYPWKNARLAWTTAVPDAARSGRLGDLIQYVARHDTGFLAELKNRLVQSVRPSSSITGRWYSHEDPFNCMFVGSGASRAVIDRSILRAGLRDLVDDEYRVMIISGKPRSGKSHSWVLVDHLRNDGRLAAHRFTRVTTHGWSGEITGEDLARCLAAKLGISVKIRPSVEMAEARLRKFVDAFVGKYPQGDGFIRWIIIDGLDRPGVQSTALDFARQMIALVHDGELPATRLVITGLDDINLDLERTIRRELIPAIDHATIRRFLDIVAHHLCQVVSADELDELASRALGSGNADLKEVEDAVYELVRQKWQESH